jgi:hypothetical protein
MVVAPLFGAIAILKVLSAQPPDLMVHFAPGTTKQEVDILMSEVLGTPSKSGKGYWVIDGICGTNRRKEGVLVVFCPGTSRKRRAEIVTLVRRSPAVARTSDLQTVDGVSIADR